MWIVAEIFLSFFAALLSLVLMAILLRRKANWHAHRMFLLFNVSLFVCEISYGLHVVLLAVTWPHSRLPWLWSVIDGLVVIGV